MGWTGLIMALPFLLLVLLFVFGPWSDRKGWTRVKGRERAMMGTAFQGWNMAVNPELANAVEYLKQTHDEEDAEGKKKRPHFPGVGGNSFTVRPLAESPATIAALAAWTGEQDLQQVYRRFFRDLPAEEVPCLVASGGQPVGYLQLVKVEDEARIGPCLGQVDDAAIQILLGYLFEFEGVNEATVGNTVFRRSAFQAPPFHILFT